jgi:hypothetical protein
LDSNKIVAWVITFSRAIYSLISHNRWFTYSHHPNIFLVNHFYKHTQTIFGLTRNNTHNYTIHPHHAHTAHRTTHTIHLMDNLVDKMADLERISPDATASCGYCQLVHLMWCSFTISYTNVATIQPCYCLLYGDFYFRAFGSLVVLSFPQLVSFSSVLSKPLSETLTSAGTAGCPTGQQL